MNSYLFFAALSAFIFVSLALCPAAPLSPLVTSYSDLICYAPVTPITVDDCETPATIYLKVATHLAIALKDSLLDRYYSSPLPAIISSSLSTVTLLAKSLAQSPHVSLVLSKASQLISKQSLSRSLAKGVDFTRSLFSKTHLTQSFTQSFAKYVDRIQNLIVFPFKSLSSRLSSSDGLLQKSAIRLLEMVRLVIGKTFGLRIALAWATVVLIIAVAFYHERKSKLQSPIDIKHVLGLTFLLKLFKSSKPAHSIEEEAIQESLEEPLEESLDDSLEQEAIEQEKPLQESLKQEAIEQIPTQESLQETRIEYKPVTVNDSTSKQPPKLTFKSINWDEYPYSERARLYYALNSGKSVNLQDYQKQEKPVVAFDSEPSYAEKAVAYYEQIREKRKLNCSEPPDCENHQEEYSPTLNDDTSLLESEESSIITQLDKQESSIINQMDKQEYVINQLEEGESIINQMESEECKADYWNAWLSRDSKLDDYEENLSTSQLDEVQERWLNKQFDTLQGFERACLNSQEFDDYSSRKSSRSNSEISIDDVLDNNPSFEFDLAKRAIDQDYDIHSRPKFTIVNKTIEDLDFLVEDSHLLGGAGVVEEWKPATIGNLNTETIQDGVVKEWKQKTPTILKANVKKPDDNELQKLVAHLNNLVGQLQLRKLQIHKEIFPSQPLQPQQIGLSNIIQKHYLTKFKTH